MINIDDIESMKDNDEERRFLKKAMYALLYGASDSVIRSYINQERRITMNENERCDDERPRNEAGALRPGRPEPQPICTVEPMTKEVRIRPLNHGYVVEVGCQSFAIESADKLTALINQYLKDPVEVEKAWLRKDKNNKFYPDL